MLAPVRMRLLDPVLVRPMAPPPLPVVSAMLLLTVNAEAASKPIAEPAAKPPVLLPFAPPRFVRRVVTSLVPNWPVPLTLSMSVPPLATLIFDAVQLAVELLKSEVVVANCKVPALMLILPVFVLVPLRVRADVALFCVMFVTFEPTPPLIVTLPVPLPELVIVPMLLAEAVEIVMPLAVELSLLMTRLPVPVMPPVTERFAVLPL